MIKTYNVRIQNENAGNFLWFENTLKRLSTCKIKKVTINPRQNCQNGRNFFENKGTIYIIKFLVFRLVFLTQHKFSIKCAYTENSHTLNIINLIYAKNLWKKLQK